MRFVISEAPSFGIVCRLTIRCWLMNSSSRRRKKIHCEQGVEKISSMSRLSGECSDWLAQLTRRSRTLSWRRQWR